MIPLSSLEEDFSSFGYRVPQSCSEELGLFGNSVRSDFPPLMCLNPGFPHFLDGTAFLAVNDTEDNHTRMWCSWPEFRGSVSEYADAIKNKKTFTSLFGENYETKFLLKSDINNIILYLNSLKRFISDVDESFQRLEEKKIIDPDLAVLVTWMDT